MTSTRRLAALLLALAAQGAHAAILWAGGEDVDFPLGSMLSVATSSIYHRATYSRVAVAPNVPGGTSRSITFSGGAITSGWLSAYIINPNVSTSNLGVGLCKQGTSSGIMVGSSSASPSRLALFKWDAGTKTQIAAETGNTLATGTAPVKVDIHVSNYGASTAIDVYTSGNLVISYSGDPRASGVTDLDCACLALTSSSNWVYTSEVVVADEDTRLFSLATLAPSAAGDTLNWTGAYTTLNETTLDDSTVSYVTTQPQDALFNVADLPAGTFITRAVKLAYRGSMGASGISGIKPCVVSGGTTDCAATQTQTSAWVTAERLMSQNPVTANTWSTSEVNALQIGLRSAP